MSDGQFRGRVALCTGAGRRAGLGAAILHALAAEGCTVVFTDLLESGGSLAAEHIGTTEEIQQLAAEINQAGGTAACMSLDAFLCTKHAAAQMIRQGQGGRIVNIASQAAKSGHLHMAAYTASKHGMIGLTRSSALELGPHGITVNAICPNHVTTGLGAVQNAYFARLRGFAGTEEYLADMRLRIPLRRVGLTTDTAKACAFLCSDAASYVTGEAMNVSGGVEMH